MTTTGIERVMAIVVNESWWLTASMGIALASIVVLLVRQRRAGRSLRARIMAAMNLFFGVTIGAMAFGHLLAVTVKLAAGTLEGSVPAFYAIGLALAIPSWSVAAHSRRLLRSDVDPRRTTLALNAWLALTLLVLGIHNAPLAAPGLFNVAYALHTRRAAGWTIVAIAALFTAALFVAALVFLASGRSFEEFRSM